MQTLATFTTRHGLNTHLLLVPDKIAGAGADVHADASGGGRPLPAHQERRPPEGPHQRHPQRPVREGRVREVCQQPSGGPGQRIHVARRRAPGLRHGRVRRFQGRSRALGPPVQGHGRLMTPFSVGGAHQVSALSFSPLHSRSNSSETVSPLA
uniref:Uncharacterized protein n=1 Tax=Ixodes ricinus TaxID=34613 RepID=A0A6B0UVF0_IXORI